LTQINGNSVNNCDFLSPYYLLWVAIVIIHPGAKKHSYTTVWINYRCNNPCDRSGL